MLRHVIAPVRRFTQISHDVVRHPRLNSDAKILIVHVQGLPEGADTKPLGEHAADLGMKPRAYQRAKEALVACGFLHEWKWQTARGRWLTGQLLANVPLTSEEANRLRSGVPLDPSPPESPAVGKRAVGKTAGRKLGGSPPEDKDGEKNTPHPPPEAPAPAPEPQAAPEPAPEPVTAPAAPVEPEVAEAERVLLTLRHSHRELLLGFREVRGLAELAAEWLRAGVSAADLRHALTSSLPRDGVRSAVGFLRHRLIQKLPVAPPRPAGPAPGALVACEGPGDDHVFRPVGDETHCPRCRSQAAGREAGRPAERQTRASWRSLVAEAAGTT